MPVKTIKRKKLSLKKIIILLLVLYIVSYMVYYLMTLPIKNIYISGTSYLNDYEIIEVANLKKYPSLLKTRTRVLEKKIRSLELVSDVKIKKNLLGKLTIDIKENKILFLNKGTNKIVFADTTTSSNVDKYYGIPTLINYVPDSIYKKLISGLAKIDNDTVRLISEIEYSPVEKDGITIDGERLLLRMNDGNHVYINIINILKFNNYSKIYSSFEGKKGTLYLDSNIENASTFTPFSIEEEVVNEEEL